jgi:hypothetical protein
MDINRQQFYVTLYSNASRDLFAENTLSSFTNQLAQPIDLGSVDEWEVGICEFSYPQAYVGNIPPKEVIGAKHALIYCDLIAPQFVGSQYTRCMRTIIHPSKSGEFIFRNIYYLPVERRTFRSISIAVKNTKGEAVHFKDSLFSSKVVLHFRRVYKNPQ